MQKSYLKFERDFNILLLPRKTSEEIKNPLTGEENVIEYKSRNLNK